MLELAACDDMKPEKREQIRRLADTVRKALKLRTPTTLEELERAVGALGGYVVEAGALGHEASIRKTAGGFEVALDRKKPPTRQLFSLGHELGHLFVHMGFANPDVWRDQTEYVESYARSGYDEEEFVAHEFAASLLMPRDEFAKQLKAHSIGEVARYFGVSHEAALMRGRWLGIIPWS
jgi:predicted transcriptional regulator